MILLPGVAEIWGGLPEARVVGGAVRDGLAGRAVADVDFASPLPPGVVVERLERVGMKVVLTGLAHGTVTAVVSGRGFEITTLRRDVETDGRRAVVVFTDDWEADAARRDFTINAMSMGRDGVIYDYFGGREDLAKGVVRFVGVAAERIAEDYLRILRFFRFFARYGGVADGAAVTAIRALRDGILRLSVERVWSELKRILMADDPRAAVRLMESTGVLELVAPEGADVERFQKVVASGAPPDVLLRVAALLAGDVVAFCERLKVANDDRDIVESLCQKNELWPAATDVELRRALANMPGPLLIGRTWLAQDGTGDWDGLRSRLAAMQRPVFPLQGRDLVALGISAGPGIGKALLAVRRWWVDGGCEADLRACLDKAVQLIDMKRQYP